MEMALNFPTVYEDRIRLKSVHRKREKVCISFLLLSSIHYLIVSSNSKKLLTSNASSLKPVLKS